MLAAQNPYSPGSGRRPYAIVGRTDELVAFDTLRARTANHRGDRGIVLTGLRGVGKTVLLNEMHQMAVQFEWLTVRFEAHRDDDGAFTVRHVLARELVAAARRLSRVKRTQLMKNALSTIASYNAHVGATNVQLGVPLNDRADTGDLEFDLLELVEDISAAMAEHGRAFAIFIDEMQDLDAATMGALLAAQHAANQRDLPFYVIGAGLPNLPRVLTDARSYAERLFNYRAIDKLSATASEEAMAEPARRLGAEFSPDAIEVLLAAADGYPYFIQEYGQAVWNVSEKQIRREDALAAVQFGTEQLDAGFFRSRWDRASRSERRMLRAMAEDGAGPCSTSTVATRMGIKASSIGPNRAALIAKGLVFSPEHGQIAFTVPGMAGYIRRNHPDVDHGGGTDERDSAE
jgi:hypothetical protein